MGWVGGGSRCVPNCKSGMVVVPACLPSPPNRWQPLGKVLTGKISYRKSASAAIRPHRRAVQKKPVWWSQRTKRGLQLAPLALLLLHDQGYKGWCHGGHGTSYHPSGTSCGVTHGLHTAPMADAAVWLQKLTSCKKFCPSKPFPKAAICLGEMGGRLGLLPCPIYS